MRSFARAASDVSNTDRKFMNRQKATGPRITRASAECRLT
jgi:hypothetical protein